MPSYPLPQPEKPVPAQAKALSLEQRMAAQRRSESAQSLVISLIILGLIGFLLYLIVIAPGFQTAETLVTYQAPPVPEENPVDRPDLAQGLRPKPSSSSSSMARVIAAAVQAPVAVPVPEITNPTTPFGTDDDFAAGFGSGDGDGDGGGGSSFFGTPRKGKRVVYCVDFSSSMRASTEAGGTRLAALKKELVRSISSLSSSMNFNVVFFAQSAWTIATPGPNRADNGWNGLNEVPPVPWHLASDRIKGVFAQEINGMGMGKGTVWYSPLKMALSASPQPDAIYLLSDGEPGDLEDVLFRMKEINPNGIPIDTIALETPGAPAKAMLELAEHTGGQFTMVYKGKPYRGRAAEKYARER